MASGKRSQREMADLQDEITFIERSLINGKGKLAGNVREQLERIRQKKHQLNDFVPIVTLVPEVLVVVFAHCRPPRNAYRHDPRFLYAWIKVTHVCQRWREAALNHPRLWNEIYATNVHMIRLLRSRSRRAPLSLIYGDTFKSVGDERAVMKELLRSLGRAESLEIYGFEEHTLGPVVRTYLSNVPTPLLEDLAVEYDAFRGMGIAHQTNTFALLDCPRLRLLSIEGGVGAINHRNLLRPSLQELRLTNPDNNSQSSIKDVKLLLDTLPGLKILELTRFLQQDHIRLKRPGPRSEPKYIVHLPQLRQLIVRDSLPSAADLLRSLSHPAATSLTLELDNTPADWGRGLADLADLLEPTFNHHEPSEKGIAALYLNVEHSHMTMRAWTPREARDFTDWNQGPLHKAVLPRLHVDISHWTPYTFEDFLSKFHTQDVQRLWLHGSFRLTTNDLWLSNRHFPSVTALSVHGDAAQALPSILQNRKPSNDSFATGDNSASLASQRTSSTFFPRLQLVQFWPSEWSSPKTYRRRAPPLRKTHHHDLRRESVNAGWNAATA